MLIGGINGWGLSPRGRGNLFLRLGFTVTRGSTPAWAGKPIFPECGRPARTVYPRVGGETQFLRFSQKRTSGLPPRGRGNRLPQPWFCLCTRSTPAWAGKPTCHGWLSSTGEVYPRVGGETAT